MMHSAWRRGNASIFKIVKNAPIFSIPTARNSTPRLVVLNVSRLAISSRFFHISPAAEHNGMAAAASEQRPLDAGDRTLPEAVPILSKFHELADHQLVHPNIIRAITEGMGHHTMTEVQKLTIRESLKGGDM
jgi:ATP-dependent RNA helicase MSS116, mitochondrial